MLALRLPVLMAFLSVAACVQAEEAVTRHTLRIEDLERAVDVGDPQCSPDGQWVAYTVTSVDTDEDKRKTSIWMVSWDGRQDLRLTYGAESETSPRWSPDGRYLAFLSSRTGAAKGTQVWLLDRRGGEARQLTHVKEKLGGFEWSPDSQRLALVASADEDPDPEAPKGKPAPPKLPKPVVTDRYHFKQDGEGYLTGASRSHVFVFEVASRKLEALTTQTNFEEKAPVWSPDGRLIAFASNHDPDPDRTATLDVFVIEPRAGATPRKVVSAFQPDNQRLAWSPDGQFLAFLQGGEAKFNAYNVDTLAVAPVGGGPVRALTAELDRPVSSPVFDGTSLLFLAADDRSQYPARVALAGGAVERLAPGASVVSALSHGGMHTAVRMSTDATAPELYALENGGLRRLTAHNDALMGELKLGAVDDITFASKDGAEIHGMVVKPPGYEAGRKYPTILWIHGGPNSQDAHGLELGAYRLAADRQLFAAQGYVVLAINYRGSSGRGAAFTRAIAADWGDKEVADLLAGVDFVVKEGLADPERLGIGGWSYGGILTDYTIASDGRFKAAISGAGSANQISMYGADQYVLQYDNELGPPWRSPELWRKLSYAFFHADRIHTPTLFLGGEKDFNVPIAGGEQMYQALKTLGVPTQLVVYPGEYHGISRPSFVRDRLERYLAWFAANIKK